MRVKTADLKNNLSKYLNRIRDTGETIVVCDRDEPIATLTPIGRDADAEWERLRVEALARAEKIGIKIEIPPRRPSRAAKPSARPTLAPDRRRDIRTIDLVRKERDY